MREPALVAPSVVYWCTLFETHSHLSRVGGVRGRSQRRQDVRPTFMLIPWTPRGRGAAASAVPPSLPSSAAPGTDFPVSSRGASRVASSPDGLLALAEVPAHVHRLRLLRARLGVGPFRDHVQHFEHLPREERDVLLPSAPRSGISAAMKSGKKSAAGEARTPRSTAQHASWTSVKACTRRLARAGRNASGVTDAGPSQSSLYASTAGWWRAPCAQVQE